MAALVPDEAWHRRVVPVAGSIRASSDDRCACRTGSNIRIAGRETGEAGRRAGWPRRSRANVFGLRTMPVPEAAEGSRR